MTTVMPDKEEAEEKVQVWNTEDMDRETFCLHMTYRHADSLGGMDSLSPDGLNDYTEELWRSPAELPASPPSRPTCEEYDSNWFLGIEMGFLVKLNVPARMSVADAERALKTCVSFGRPVIEIIYDVPAKPEPGGYRDGHEDGDGPRTASKVPESPA